MKNAQSFTFNQVRTFVEENSKTNFANFGQYQYVTGEYILEFIDNYVDNENLIFNLEDEQLMEYLYEWADSNTPIYYNELAEWFSKNWTAIDEYSENFGTCPNGDIMKKIQAAYCWTLENAMQTALYNIQKDILK